MGPLNDFKDTSTESDEKLAELILYLAEKSVDDIHFGAIKLNKLLYYSDFAAYRILGNPITGTEYQHLREGPAPRRFLPVRRCLLEDGSIEIRQEQVIDRVRERIIPKREHKSNFFSKEERALIDDVVKTFWHMNGTQIRNRSHEEFGWRITKEGETIHYRTAWVDSEPLSMEHIEIGKEIAKRHGLLKTEVGA